MSFKKIVHEYEFICKFHCLMKASIACHEDSNGIKYFNENKSCMVGTTELISKLSNKHFLGTTFYRTTS